MTIEPRLERKVVHRPAPSRGGIGSPIGQDTRDRFGQSVRFRRLVPFEAVRMGHAYPCIAADELRHPAAAWVDDGKPGGHGLDDDAGAGVVDLRVEEHVGTPEDRGRIGL